MKVYKDKPIHVKPQTLRAGDQVLLRQKSTKRIPPYDPEPYTVVDIHGTQITGPRPDCTKTRDSQRWRTVEFSHPPVRQGPLIMEDGEADVDLSAPPTHVDYRHRGGHEGSSMSPISSTVTPAPPPESPADEATPSDRQIEIDIDAHLPGDPADLVAPRTDGVLRQCGPRGGTSGARSIGLLRSPGDHAGLSAIKAGSARSTRPPLSPGDPAELIALRTAAESGVSVAPLFKHVGLHSSFLRSEHIAGVCLLPVSTFPCLFVSSFQIM